MSINSEAAVLAGLIRRIQALELAIGSSTVPAELAAIVADVAAAQAELAAFGLVGTAVLASDQTGITTVTDITGVTVTWTADPARAYLITLQVGAADQITTAGTQAAHITDSSNVIKRSASEVQSANARGAYYLSVIESGLTGSQTRKGRFQTSAGTTTLTATSAASFAPRITVEDIGPA